MKIKLSKTQWEKIGKTAGWMGKKSADLHINENEDIYYANKIYEEIDNLRRGLQLLENLCGNRFNNSVTKNMGKIMEKISDENSKYRNFIDTMSSALFQYFNGKYDYKNKSEKISKPQNKGTHYEN